MASPERNIYTSLDYEVSVFPTLGGEPLPSGITAWATLVDRSFDPAIEIAQVDGTRSGDEYTFRFDGTETALLLIDSADPCSQLKYSAIDLALNFAGYPTIYERLTVGKGYPEGTTCDAEGEGGASGSGPAVTTGTGGTVRFLTWQEVLDQLLSFLPPQWRANFTGKITKRLFVTYSLAMEGLYGLLAKVLRLAIVATSEGEYLRDLVAGFGMSAYGGVAANVALKFERYGSTDSAILIPASTGVQTQGGLTFLTDNAASLAVGESSVLVPATCSTPGTGGNIAAGQVLALRTAIQGINSVSNPDPGTGGEDPESDTSIRNRVPIHLAMLHRATIPATEGAINSQIDLFPEVRSFATQRQVGVPGYVRGLLEDNSGGDLYRPASWLPTTFSGVYYTIPNQTPAGLVETGWPCKRFGVVARDSTGKEIWTASPTLQQVSQGDYRWHYDGTRLYARAQGQDLSNLELTVVSGVIERALTELESRWIAAGVQVDIIAPSVKSIDISLTYELAPGASASTVDAALTAAVSGFMTSLQMGQTLELESFYATLNGVEGAIAVLLTEPSSNVVVPSDQIGRAGTVSIQRVG